MEFVERLPRFVDGTAAGEHRYRTPQDTQPVRADQRLTRRRHALFGSIERSNDSAGELGRFQLEAIVHFLWQAGPGFARWNQPLNRWMDTLCVAARSAQFFASKRGFMPNLCLALVVSSERCHPLNAVTNARFLSYAGLPVPGSL